MFAIFDQIVTSFPGYRFDDRFFATQAKKGKWALSYNGCLGEEGRRSKPFFAIEFDVSENKKLGDGNRKLYILEFWIPQEARRVGWGTKLYGTIEYFGRCEAVDFIQLTATGESKTFWSKLGFAPLGLTEVAGVMEGVWQKSLKRKD